MNCIILYSTNQNIFKSCSIGCNIDPITIETIFKNTIPILVQEAVKIFPEYRFGLEYNFPTKMKGSPVIKSTTLHCCMFHNNKLCCYALITCSPFVCEFWNIFTIKSYQGTKINNTSTSQFFINSVINLIQSQFNPEYRLIVHRDNPYFQKATKLYINCGFIPIEQYQDGNKTAVMMIRKTPLTEETKKIIKKEMFG